MDPAASAAVAIAALVIAVVIVPVTVETASRGRSLGKLTVGARVVRDDGGSIGFRHALVRGLTGVLEILMTFGGLAAVVGLLSRRSRRLGDVLAGTHSQLERVPVRSRWSSRSRSRCGAGPSRRTPRASRTHWRADWRSSSASATA